MPDFKHVRRILDRAERARHIVPAGRHHQLWASEFWWDSDPPDHRYGVPVRKHARWIEEALYLLWKQGARVAMLLQIRDAQFSPEITSHQTGVFFYNGSRKPAFRAFQFPFVTHRHSNRRVVAWGKAPVGGTLRIERRRHGRWRSIKHLSIGGTRVFSARIGIRGAAKLRATVGGQHSLVWRQRG